MLLDTHVLLWLVSDPDRLGPYCHRSIRDAASVHVSSITHAELAIKVAIGKLDLPPDLPSLLADQGLQPLEFTQAHASVMGEFPELARHDPFDRMLLAQAARERLTFATADSRLLTLDRPWVMDARI